MRLSQRRGALLKQPSRRVTGTFETHSSLLRGGAGGFSVVSVTRERGEMWNSDLGWALAADRLRVWLWFVGGLASLLFDNRIGRKRDVGGGVLAGLRSSG
jgi:hypothetical protein